MDQRAKIIDWLLRCNTTDPISARQGRMAAAVIIGAWAASVVGMLGYLVLGAAAMLPGYNPAGFAVGAGTVLVVLAVLFAANRAGLTEVAGFGLAALALGFATFYLAQEGITSGFVISLVVPVIIAGLFGPAWSSAAYAALGIGVFFGLGLSQDASFFSNVLRNDALGQLAIVVTANVVFAALMSTLFARSTRRAIRQSANLSMQLIDQREQLERRLVTQTRQLQATVTVSRSVAGERDLDRLLSLIVRLVRETFGYYHVQVFLVDEDGKYAVLRESTGDVGQALLARGHRLAVGSLTVIGQVTANGRSLTARDTDRDAIHRHNELLPRTRSELAIPLAVGDRVIGALDLQSVEPTAFTGEDVPILQALADQLAIAIENARLFEQTQQNLRELRELSGENTRRNWQEFLHATRPSERRAIYGPEPAALSVHRESIVDQVLRAGAPVVNSGKDGSLPFIAVPIVVRNQVVGVLGVEPGEHERTWTRDDLNLLQGMAERAALAIENARLYMQAQRAVERERLINQIAARLQRAPSLAMLLESATRELAEVLGTDTVYAEISLDKPLSAENAAPPQAEAPHRESIEAPEVPGEDDTTEEARV